MKNGKYPSRISRSGYPYLRALDGVIYNPYLQYFTYENQNSKVSQHIWGKIHGMRLDILAMARIRITKYHHYLPKTLTGWNWS